MTIPVMTVIVILLTHFLADFIAQNDWMALNKSKSWLALTTHVLAYTGVMAGIGVFLFGLSLTQLRDFLVVTAVTHFITDAITSRQTSRLWQQSKRHWFFVMIGFDQWIHEVQLVLTAGWILSGGHIL